MSYEKMVNQIAKKYFFIFISFDPVSTSCKMQTYFTRILVHNIVPLSSTQNNEK